MKNKLKKITDETVNSLLQNDIILPSTYFKEFDKNAKLLDVNLNDVSFEKEVKNVIVDEFKVINSYMNNTISNIEKISNATQNAKTAIQNRDENELAKIYQQMEELKNEINELQHEIYVDSLTQTHNKKWLYSEFIDSEGNTKQSGIIAQVYINDYTYVREEHGGLIADNLIIFISGFIRKHLSNEGINFDIARYTKDRFLIIFYDNNLKEITVLLNDIQKNLFNSTLKSKSGILIKSSYQFNLLKFKQNSDFQNLLELLINDLKNKKNPLTASSN